MRILILSFYYPPDLCAGSFRSGALVAALLNKLPKNINVDVITTLPNRYKSFSAEAPELEKQSNLTVQRIKLPGHQSGMIDQAWAFIIYALKAVQKTRNRDYVLIYATSSRLMTAMLGAFLSDRKQAVLYLDIRDIFVDTIKDVLPGKVSVLAKPIFSFMEKWSILRASKVNLVSEGFKIYFLERYPKKLYSFFTNGIDTEFYAAVGEKKGTSCLRSPMTVLYAGNIGEGQGLHEIIPSLAKRMKGRLQFKLIGDGGRKLQLEKNLKAGCCDNVEIIPPVQREQLLVEYKKADILFLHLNDYDAFRKVLPSKLFEYAAIGKPIWAGVSGYSAQFIKKELSNTAVFYPCNAIDAELAFSSLTFETTDRSAFTKRFRREKIMEDMAADVLSSISREAIV